MRFANLLWNKIDVITAVLFFLALLCVIAPNYWLSKSSAFLWIIRTICLSTWTQGFPRLLLIQIGSPPCLRHLMIGQRINNCICFLQLIGNRCYSSLMRQWQPTHGITHLVTSQCKFVSCRALATRAHFISLDLRQGTYTLCTSVVFRLFKVTTLQNKMNTVWRTLI